MKKVFMIIIGVIALIILVVTSTFTAKYNSLVELDEEVQLAQANVQEKMQRRAELIPDLVKVIKSHAKHEETVYTNIANARTALKNSFETGDPQKISDANNNLTNEIGTLINIVKESYPELNSDKDYIQVMDKIDGSINRISIARDSYNLAVSKYNKKIRKFPERIYANIFGFEKYETFKAVEGANATNIVDFEE